jgi:RHS repeat-associated protein
MAGISDKAIKTNYAENKYRYNSGNELQSKEFSDGSGLEMYDAGFRQLDPQLGRFSQIDPLSEQMDFSSTYQYANDNPITMNDPNGLKAQKPPPSLLSPNVNVGAGDIMWSGNWMNAYYLEQPSTNGPGDGGGMYIGNGIYQLPDGEYADQQTALAYATNKYPGASQSFYGSQASALYGYLTGQANISVTNNNGAQTLNFSYNSIENGVPVVHSVSMPDLTNSFGATNGLNSGILSPTSFNFRPMWRGSNAYEAGVSGLSWDINIQIAPGMAPYLRHIDFPTLYVQFPKKTALGIKYDAWEASTISATAFNEALYILWARYQASGATYTEGLSNDQIVRDFIAEASVMVSLNTILSKGYVTRDYHGQNTIVTQAQWVP